MNNKMIVNYYPKNKNTMVISEFDATHPPPCRFYHTHITPFL